MRLIYSFLAVWQIRLARFDIARSERLTDDAQEAFAKAGERARLADRLMVRAGLPVIFGR